MADSLLIYFPLDPLTDHEYEHASLRLNGLLPFNQDGVKDRKTKYDWMYPKSVLTGAGFAVKPVGMPGADSELRIAGYLVDINVPACTVGNNLLLVNGVPRAAELALLLLQHWLLSQGGRRHGAFSLRLATASIKSVTLTYLFMLRSLEEAQEARWEFAMHADGMLNQRYLARPRASKKPVRWIGAGNVNTYVEDRDGEASAYVKDGENSDAFVRFPSPEIEQLIRPVAEKCLRVEQRFKGGWLREKNLDRVDSWVTRPGKSDPYEIGMTMIRKKLRLDEGLRQRRPKETDIAKLYVEDQKILRWHLEGNNPRRHPRVLSYTDGDARNRFFADVKARVYGKCRVDISIPWAAQSTAYSHRLAELLQFANRYTPPPHLADHVYSPKSVARVLPLLKQKVRAITPRGIGSVHVAPRAD
ncbi:hypothetical protein LGN17_21415 [Burkholderia sp. AU30280]|uniref:hypothetical protein n=1 Tax=Burkholderia sp. AU30280 TaxID=2879628 RepID=UPI001CF5FA95|nr:hypothetical protein [Burkholderia sp. AU30280]MCA8275048.1 hypothetical protein [Burkholderia sp. AU30280]